MKQPAITTVVLAGGLGTRIGGDKGLQLLHGKALIDWVLEIVSPQSDEVLVNANTNHDLYAARGYRVIADPLPNYAGPLAGLQAALLHARHDWVVSVPCDTPFLPHDLLARLWASAPSDVAIAVAAGQRQPAVALYHKRVLPKLNAYLDSGGRKVYDWLEILPAKEVRFEDSNAFTNINSLQELAFAHQR